VIWGHTYETTIKPLFILQKKVVRVMTFSSYNAHTNKIFLDLKLLKLADIIFPYTALFMYDYHHENLPVVFSNLFNQVNNTHKYNTRLASKLSYSLPRARTNFGKFNIRFSGVKCWNAIDGSIKKLETKSS